MNKIEGKLANSVARWLIALLLCLAIPPVLSACSGASSGSSGEGGNGTKSESSQGATSENSNGSTASATNDETSGPAFDPGIVEIASFDSSSALDLSGCRIDVSHIKNGYVGASAESTSRLKFEVAKDGASMYYDMPQDGTPIIAPLSMGDGEYDFAIWENTSGQKYAKLAGTTETVEMTDEYQPFLHNSFYCEYDKDSKATELAAELAKDAENAGDVLANICNWVVDNVVYDRPKAKELSGKSGYVPDPDDTVRTKSGICFDYSSLVAAMLRSQGIPCKIVTGNVAPNDIYHAWNMVFIDGTWVNTYIDVKSKTWTRLDSTFVASGADNSFVGDGTNYSERYTY